MVRWVKDNRTLSTIHPVRAMLICEILFQKLLEDEANVLLNTIQFTNYYPQTLLIDYFYRKSIDSAFLTKLSNISFTTWVTYAGILESLLWLSVWQYYKKYESVIDEGNSLTNNTFAFVFITEVTGYLTIDRSFHDIIREQNPTKFLHMSTLLERIAEKSICYEYVDEFMKNTIDSLPFHDALSSSTLTYCGFSLFWIAQRNLRLDETRFNEIIETLDVTNIFSVCELCLGMQKQRWHKHYDYALRKLKPLLTEQLNIVYLDDESCILQEFVINDFQSNAGNHGKIMLAVNALRLLYCEKEEYHVTLIGSDIIEGIPVLDNIKKIKNDNLPYKWITRLNGWYLSIDGYKYLLSDWKATFDEIIDKRQEVQEFATYLAKAIDDCFSKRKIDKFTDKAYLKRESLFKYANYNINLPKCASNMHGMSIGISNFDDISSSLKEKAKKKKTNNDEESSAKEYLSVIKVFNDYIQDMQKFLIQKDDLLVDKLKNNDISRLGRLSWVNLMFMLEKFPQMVSIFKQEFSKFITNESCDINEEENLLLLGIMWEYVYSNPYRIEEAVMYDKKRELKKKKEIITKFIEDVIPNIQGVQEVVHRENNEIFILLDIHYGDSFIEDIWTQHEKLFGKLEYASFDYALLTLFFKKISIQYSFDTEPTIGGFEISIMDFTKDYKEEFFASVRSKAIGFDNYYWSIQDNRFKYILTILGLIENIPIILKHVEDVLSYFEQMQDEKLLILATVNKWKFNCNALTKDIFMQINNASKVLNEYLRHEEQRNLLSNFVDVTDSLLSIDDFLISLVASGDKYKNDFLLIHIKKVFQIS